MPLREILCASPLGFVHRWNTIGVLCSRNVVGHKGFYLGGVGGHVLNAAAQ